jgi:hypothetical protein
MFYGASTIEQNNKSAVGCLRRTAQKYARIYGPGAMVFLHGCGDRLSAELCNDSVMTLDCSGTDMFNFDELEEQMRTYCSTPNGDILP